MAYSNLKNGNSATVFFAEVLFSRSDSNSTQTEPEVFQKHETGTDADATHTLETYLIHISAAIIFQPIHDRVKY